MRLVLTAGSGGEMWSDQRVHIVCDVCIVSSRVAGRLFISVAKAM